MKRYTLDRFEGKYAVLLLRPDETEQIDILAKELPSDVNEGDILKIEFTKDEEIKHIQVLKGETDQAKKRAEDLIQKLINKNK